MPYTEEDLAGLTEEERAAMLEEEDEQDGADDEGADDAQEDEGQADDGANDEGDAGDDASNADEGDAAADDGADDGDDEAEPEQADVRQQAPILVAAAPEDADARLQKIADDKAALIEQFDDGDLTAKEYQQKLDALSKEEREIERQVDRAQLAADMEVQRQENEREAQINGFLAEHKIKRDFSDLRFAALDSAVKLVAGRPENAELSVRDILQKAHDECVSQGILQSKAAPVKAEAKPAEAKPRRQIDAPPTLAKVPAADMSDTDEGNRFAWVDRLDPVAREAAFAKMSAADQEAYLASA